MKIKRTLAFLLALVMIFGMLPTIALAEEAALPENLVAPLPAEVQADLTARGINVSHVWDFDASSFGASGGAAIVEDAAATNSTAWNLNLDTIAAVPFDFASQTGSIGFTGVGWVAHIPVADMKANSGKGYVVYKLADIALPGVAGETNLDQLAMFPGTPLLCSSDIVGKTNTMAGHTVDIYVSMKTEGNFDWSKPYPSYFVDRIIFVDSCENYLTNVTETAPTCAEPGIKTGTCTKCAGTYTETTPTLEHTYGDYVVNETTGQKEATCSACGDVKVYIPENLVAALPDEVAVDLNARGINISHVWDFDASDFNAVNATFVEDADATNGLALCQDFNTNLTYDFASIPAKVGFANYGGIVTIPVAEMNANSGKGYQLYKLEDVQMPGTYGESIGQFYMFDGGPIQGSSFLGKTNTMAGNVVDIYISMKVEGNFDWSQPYPSISVDRVIFVDSCFNYLDEDTVTETVGGCTEPGVITGTCSVCEGTYTDTTPAPGHSYGDYVVNETTGQKEATCSACGDVKTYIPENLVAALPDEVALDLNTRGIDVFHVWDFDADDFNASGATLVEDAEAVNGSAMCQDFNLNLTYDFASIPAKVGFANYGGIVTIPVAEMSANSGMGYQLYKLTDVQMPGTYGENIGQFYMFDGGPIQGSSFNGKTNTMAGNVIDIYISMKVEGNFDWSEPYPKCYVDRVIFVDTCFNYLEEDTISEKAATCTEAGSITGICYVCEGTYTDIIPKLDHVYGEYVLNEETGMLEAACTYGCGTVDTKVQTYTVNFFVGEDTFATQTVNHGEYAADPGELPMEGMTFVGWFNGEEPFDFSTPITSDLTLVAKYEEAKPEVEPIPYAFTASMTAALELESEVFLNVAPQLTKDGKALTAAEAQSVEGNVGILIWDAATAPAEADATIDTCDNIILGATYNTGTKRFDVKSEGIAAKNLGDTLTIRAFYKDGDQIIYGKYVAAYSPKQYCYNQINKDAATKDVCIALLNYGAAAQVYFGHNTDSLMNAELTAAQQTIAWSDDMVRSTWTVDAAKEGGLTRQNPPVNSRAGTLELEGAINVVFTGGVKSISVAKAQLLIWNEADFAANDVLTAENATEVVDMTLRADGKYEYTYTGVPAKGMFDTIYACQMYTDAEGNVYYGGVLPFCAERYGYMNYNKADTKVANLAKAMIVYGDAARAYFG